MTEFDDLARSFGAIAEEYERARPSYPPEAVESAIEDLYLGLDATALDLAAGTGKLTRLLERRFKRVMAVEPQVPMLEMIRSALPGVEALEGDAGRIPLDDSAVDVVFVAQAFHWFANHEALREIARVLKADGGLALIWNTSPWESHATPWWTRFDEVLHDYAGDVQNVRQRTSAEWKPAFEGDQPFEPLREREFRHSQRIALADFPSVVASRSYVTVLPQNVRAALLADLTKLLADSDAPVQGDTLTIDYTTELYLTTAA